jgi:hypothetical protein
MNVKSHAMKRQTTGCIIREHQFNLGVVEGDIQFSTVTSHATPRAPLLRSILVDTSIYHSSPHLSFTSNPVAARRDRSRTMNLVAAGRSPRGL